MCYDTNVFATGLYDYDVCGYASVSGDVCQYGYDDADFTAADMCCACGGGAATPPVIWKAVSGDCTLDGACVNSPNFPSSYGNNEGCTVEIHDGLSALIKVMRFNVRDPEYYYYSDDIHYTDYLTVNGVIYSGETGPSDITPTTSITWTTDGQGGSPGWSLCAVTSAPDAQIVVDGDCTASDGCVRSPNYPSDYGDSERCLVFFDRASVWLTPTAFATEGNYDILQVDGTDYSGDTGWPGDDPFEVTSSIRWTSDGSVQKAGWEFCLASE
jgi:hypothetical protein